MITTTDFFYPLVDDPYIQGKIGCANVLSDLYAMGVTECDTMLMLLAVSRDMSPEEQKISTKMMMRGFHDLATEAGTRVTGGQTVMNPWPIIGGVATSILLESQFIRPENAVEGDAVILTKPIGIQVAVNAHQWLDQFHRNKSTENWLRVHDIITEAEVEEAYQKASVSMSRLNRTGALLMHECGAHAATDVTGFGLMGHAENLAANQKAEVDIVISSVPVLANMMKITERVPRYRLKEGLSAETSGGLLVCLPSDAAERFCREIEARDGQPAWIVGHVVAGTRKARFSPDYTFLDV